MNLSPFLPQQSSQRKRSARNNKESDIHFIPKNSNIKLQVPQSRNALLASDLKENDEENDYEFGANVQQYNFQNLGISPQEMEEAIKSAVQQAMSAEGSGGGKSNLSKMDSELMENMKKRISQLLEENAKLRYENEKLKKDLADLQKMVAEISMNQVDKGNNRNNNNRSITQKHSDYQLFKEISPRKLNSKQSSLFTSPKKWQTNNNNINSPNNNNKSSKTISNPLLKQLLLDCNESNEFETITKNSQTKGTLNDQANKRDQFYEYKDTKDCYEPFYSNLARDSQLRLKKSMVREKELVYKDDFIEVGCISKKLSNHQFTLSVVITNIFNHSLKEINIAYLYKNDIQLSKQLKSPNLEVQKSVNNHTVYTKLGSAEQLREKLTILTNNVDFRCILINISYKEHKGQTHEVTQILPGCKHKLLSVLVSTPISNEYVIAEKVVVVNRKMLPELDKLKSYYKYVQFTKDRNQNREANVKVEFLGKIFYVTLREMGSNSQNLSVGVYHAKDHFMLAQKLLSELVFVYGK